MIEQSLLSLVSNHPILLPFIAGFVMEELLIVLAALSGNGLIPIRNVAIFGLAGTLLFDIILFLTFRLNNKARLFIVKFFSKKSKSRSRLKIKNHGNYLTYIIFSKFIYGTRVLAVIYISIKKVPFQAFLLYEITALTIWGIVVLTAGWFAGKGFSYFLIIVRGIERVFAIVLVAIILVYLFNKLVTKMETKQNN